MSNFFTIPQIQAKEPNEVLIYLRNLPNYYGNENHVQSIVAELTNKALTYPVPLPPPTFIFHYWLRVFERDYSIIAWECFNNVTIFEEPFKIVAYRYACDTDKWYYIFFSQHQYDIFLSYATLLEVSPESVNMEGIPQLDELENSFATMSENSRKYFKWALLHMQCREKDDDTPDEYAGVVPEGFQENTEQDIESQSARFSGAMWADAIKEKKVVLAGIGGIGSWVAFLLSRMQIKELYMYDDDIVETVNMAGQLYNIDDTGSSKVSALARTLARFSLYNSVFTFNEKFTQNSEASDIMICGFDNMTARKNYFEAWLKHVRNTENKKKCLYIDGRLLAERFQVFCIRGDDAYNMERYSSEYLFNDSEVAETPCSYKQTTFMANLIAGVMVNLFTNFVANELVPGLRDMPFFTEYFGDSLTLKVIEP